MIREKLRQNTNYILFCVTILLVGLFYSHFVKPFGISDEGTHFYTSYMLADRIQGNEIYLSGEDYKGIKGVTPINLQIRSEDHPLFFLNSDNSINYSIGEQGVWASSSEWETASVNVSTYFRFPTYLVDALAIIIGQKCQLSCIALVYFVRFVNLCVYIGLGILAAKLMPLSKETVYIMYSLPFAIQRAASCSYDGLFFAFIWFYVCLILYYKFRKETIRPKDILIITCMSLLLAPIKGVCIAVVFMVILIPKTKFCNLLQYRVFSCLNLIGGVIVWIGYNLLSIRSDDLFMMDNPRFVEYGGVNSVNVMNLLHDPIYFVKIVIDTFVRRFTFYPSGMSPVFIDIGSLTAVGFCALLFISLLSSDDTQCLSNIDRVKCGIIYLVSYALVCILPVISWGGEGVIISPIKPSYVLSFELLLIIVLINKKMVYLGKGKDKLILIGSAAFHVIGILHVLRFVLLI